ncbi:MAG: ATP synthase F1 subunit gamma [Nitrospirae bacterium]|nr:ATP synthase F1 subunit gamma [Nitrospirota bacterium]
MASLRDIQRRIRSVKNTQQITKAMKAVSASKLKKAQAAMMAARPYANKLVSVIGSLAARTSRENHPLLAVRGSRRVEFVILTSDRGLCSSFNTNILKRTVALYAEKKAENCDITLNVIGRKGRDFLKRREYEMRKDWTGISGHLSYSHAAMIAQEVMENYVNAEVDEVYLIYNEFKSAMTQTVITAKLLPIEPPETSSDASDASGDYMYEPNAETVLETLLPKYAEFQLFRALLESEASELGARMSAMDSASTNAKEMISKLTLKYNKARQAAITKELMEIIGGAEALK